MRKEEEVEEIYGVREEGEMQKEMVVLVLGEGGGRRGIEEEGRKE